MIFIVEDSKAAVGRPLLRKECMKFVTTICSSIGVSSAEEGLLRYVLTPAALLSLTIHKYQLLLFSLTVYRLREQFPDLFHDICLYSEICAVLSSYSYHLPARRFIQELFQDIKFTQV